VQVYYKSRNTLCLKKHPRHFTVEFCLAAIVDRAAGTAGASLYWWLDDVEIDGEHWDFSSSDTVAQPRRDGGWLRQTSSTMLSSPPCPRSCHLRVVVGSGGPTAKRPSPLRQEEQLTCPAMPCLRSRFSIEGGWCWCMMYECVCVSACN